MKVIIPEDFILEAQHYASLSRSFTSNRHDFHEGGLSAKQQKMFEGKLGEKAIKKLFIDNNILFIEDSTSHEEADNYDFIVYSSTGKEILVDVKTRTKSFHTRTLEMVEQIKRKPKDIYISVYLQLQNPYSVEVLGYASSNDFVQINRIQNNGYLDNYVLFDNELKEISLFINTIKKNEK